MGFTKKEMLNLEKKKKNFKALGGFEMKKTPDLIFIIDTNIGLAVAKKN